MKSPCARGREEVLYGWASDSDGHRLPDGVAYSVGPGTGILDVVLQVNRLPSSISVPATPPPLAQNLLLRCHSEMLTAAALQQIRYTAGRPAEDRSGFSLSVGAQPLPLAAGMLTFASLFTLPPKQPAYKVCSHALYTVTVRQSACGLRVRTPLSFFMPHATHRCRIWHGFVTAKNPCASHTAMFAAR